MLQAKNIHITQYSGIKCSCKLKKLAYVQILGITNIIKYEVLIFTSFIIFMIIAS